MPSFFFSVLTADSAVGKFDRSMLDTQGLLELLVENLAAETKRAFQNAEGEYLPFSTWETAKYKVFEFDSAGDVFSIYFFDDVVGQPALEYAPDTVTDIFLNSLKLHGTLDTKRLPPDLQKLTICATKFHGSVDWSGLPRTLGKLHLVSSKFFGTLDLENLPPSVSDLNVSGNFFEGNAALTNLPRALRKIDLSKNSLLGSICLSRLPPQLESLVLFSNAFSGEIELARLPATLKEIDLSHNQLCGGLNFQNLPPALRVLLLNENSFSGELSLLKVPKNLETLSVRSNNLQGIARVHRELCPMSVDLALNRITCVRDENDKEYLLDFRDGFVAVYFSWEWRQNST